MRRQSMRALPIELFRRTAMHLNDSNLKYSIATQFLLKAFDSMLNGENQQGPSLYGKIEINLDDDEFDKKKLLICQSKIVKEFVEEKGLKLIIGDKMHDNEFIDKFQKLP